MAAKAQEKKAELSSLQRQQETDKAEEQTKARELLTHEEAAVREWIESMGGVDVGVWVDGSMGGWVDGG